MLNRQKSVTSASNKPAAKVAKTNPAAAGTKKPGCGSGAGGFKPGNTCGKGGRQALADKIRAARQAASRDGNPKDVNQAVKELKDHRRGNKGSITNEKAKEHLKLLSGGAKSKPVSTTGKGTPKLDSESKSPAIADRDAHIAHARAQIAAADPRTKIAGVTTADRIAGYNAGDVARHQVEAVHDHYESQIGAAQSKLERLHREGYSLIRDRDDAKHDAERYSPNARSAKAKEAQAKLAEAEAKHLAALAERHAVRQQIEQLTKGRNSHIHAILAVDRGHEIHATIGALEDFGRSQAPEGRTLTSITDGERFISSQFAKVADADPDLHVHYHHIAGRAHYQSTTKSRGMINVAKDSESPSVVAHEFGHVIEHQHPEIGKRSLEFLKHRVGDEKPRPMNELTKSNIYDDNEFGREDEFRKAFGDTAGYVGKDYGSRSSEILSMGIESLYKNPGHFAKADPEYFKFVHGIMNGALR